MGTAKISKGGCQKKTLPQNYRFIFFLWCNGITFHLVTVKITETKKGKCFLLTHTCTAAVPYTHSAAISLRVGLLDETERRHPYPLRDLGYVYIDPSAMIPISWCLSLYFPSILSSFNISKKGNWREHSTSNKIIASGNCIIPI